MIDINKKYRTRNGANVKIYETTPTQVVGAYWFSELELRPSFWDLEGNYISSRQESCLDLIEVNQYEDFKIDDKVLVWDICSKNKRHFAGISKNGNPLTWSDGQTSFTTDQKTEWDNCIKYEEQNDKT